ncbi:hypothetical protein J7L67_01925 [bacterium]|nr:hypothetical protein [bacterium]
MSGVDYSGTRAVPRIELGVAMQEFMTDEANQFIGTKVAPIFPTLKKEGKYPAVTRESITRDADTKRGSRGNYNRDGFEVKDKEFACKEHGLEGPLDDSDRALYASDFDAELNLTRIITRRLLQAQEKRIADLVINTSTFTGNALYKDYSGAPWATAGSDAIGQVRFGRKKIRTNCGMEANTLIVSRTNLDYLLANTAIKDAIKYTARLTEQEIKNALADLFGIEQVIVGGSIRNSAKEGSAFVGSSIWSDTYVSLARISKNGQDLSEPTLARTFLWTADSPENATVEQYREEGVRSDIFRVRQHTDEQIIDPYFGFLMKVA